MFQICACTALFFSVVHSAGHLVNFYHVATQPMEHLQCMSSEVTFPSDQVQRKRELPHKIIKYS